MLMVVLCVLAGAARTSNKSGQGVEEKWKSELSEALVAVHIQSLVSHSHFLCFMFPAESGESLIVTNRPSESDSFQVSPLPY